MRISSQSLRYGLKKMKDDIRIEKITGFAGAVFNENSDSAAKRPDPLHRLFESDRQRMFESAEDFVWIEDEKK